MVSEWISVKEQLPEYFEDILAYCISLETTQTYKKDERYFSIDQYCKWSDDRAASFRTDRFFPAKVLYWMSLPKIPEEDGS